MKIITRIEENSEEGFMALIGQRITVFCAVYIYTGELVGVNATCIKLKNPAIVYETGAFNSTEWKDAQELPQEFFYIQTGMIESFGVVK